MAPLAVAAAPPAPPPPRRRRPWLRVILGLAASVVLIVLAFAAYLIYALLPGRSPPGRLMRKLRTGMSIRQVAAQARKLGFEWHVDEKQLERKRPGGGKPGEIICHEGDREGPRPTLAGWHCEDFRNTQSFGALFSSYACHITIKDGSVADFWFYAD